MFEGVSVALITPFRDGAVDFDAFRRVARHVLDQGVQGLFPTGCTGEAAVLDDEERRSLWQIAVEETRGRGFVVAGTGTNDTRSTIRITEEAAGCGVDGCMLISPYYNKPTQAGLLAHYRAVADAVDIPLVLYNVPGRTAVNILPATVAMLAEHPRIVAIKEAAGSLDQATDILARCRITVLSGDDSLTLPMVAAGARGVVSVLGHLAGDRITAMLHHQAAGEVDAAAEIHRSLYDLTRALFLESNPGPLKAALAHLGLIRNEFRLPLVPVSEQTNEAVIHALQRAKIGK